MMKGHATAEGTSRFAGRFGAAEEAGFFRPAQGLSVSTLGAGTYLGGMDEAASEGYRTSIGQAIASGVNLLDTAINYRAQLSERDLGAALERAVKSGGCARDEIVVCTKAGYLTPGALPESLPPEAAARGRHSMDPEFIEDQVERSLKNLGLETIDVFYLHNPETQLSFVSRQEFDEALTRAFGKLEALREKGRIVRYGAATWEGFRAKLGAASRLDLRSMVGLAREAGGEGHGFRFIQLPVNLAMPEVFTAAYETIGGEAVNLAEAAARMGVTIVGSAPMLQGRLASGLPEHLREKWPEAKSDAVFALQFARSTPGVTAALAGMGSAEHVSANLVLKEFPPASAESFLTLFGGKE